MPGAHSSSNSPSDPRPICPKASHTSLFQGTLSHSGSGAEPPTAPQTAPLRLEGEWQRHLELRASRGDVHSPPTHLDVHTADITADTGAAATGRSIGGRGPLDRQADLVDRPVDVLHRVLEAHGACGTTLRTYRGSGHYPSPACITFCLSESYFVCKS